MVLDNNQQAFLELVRAGLWEKEARLFQYKKIDFQEIFRLAEEQSVTGLITAGLEHIVDVKAPQEDVLQFVGCALQLEQQNMTMNAFVAELIEKLRKKNIFAVIIFMNKYCCLHLDHRNAMQSKYLFLNWQNLFNYLLHSVLC